MLGMGFERILGGVCAPEGFYASGISCGIKPDSKPDLAVVYSEYPASVAGVFTDNDIKAAPVLVSMERVRRGKSRAIVINSGNANCMTGERGKLDALNMTQTLGETLGIPADEILVASTGKIGDFLPIENIISGIEQAAAELSPGGNTDAARAIMTTDTYPKELALEMEIRNKVVRIGAMAKGSGMIHPSMATMVCVITTDMLLSPELLSELLEKAVDWSFNRISVDGDKSTNDCVLMLANGAAFPDGCEFSKEEYEIFFRALCWLTGTVASYIVKDGEGATKLIRIVVNGASTDEGALKVARAVANSNLVKCALNGVTPNWGRIAAAAGSAGVGIDPEGLEIFIGETKVSSGGCATEFNIDEIKKILSQSEVEITLNLGLGKSSSSFLTCDLSTNYVELNAREMT
ncbi:MAG: bifunctional glutamate N-acetyltransferase/amino-acid acetyltransferase ArgJ [Actinomycetota bacterium]|nr:bifunctional glutamate N-acetyltransferase/amino-acid acetyltransferase ArgJ [Actinomycetota bacterium]